MYPGQVRAGPAIPRPAGPRRLPRLGFSGGGHGPVALERMFHDIASPPPIPAPTSCWFLGSEHSSPRPPTSPCFCCCLSHTGDRWCSDDGHEPRVRPVCVSRPPFQPPGLGLCSSPAPSTLVPRRPLSTLLEHSFHLPFSTASQASGHSPPPRVPAAPSLADRTPRGAGSVRAVHHPLPGPASCPARGGLE